MKLKESSSFCVFCCTYDLFEFALDEKLFSREKVGAGCVKSTEFVLAKIRRMGEICRSCRFLSDRRKPGEEKCVMSVFQKLAGL